MGLQTMSKQNENETAALDTKAANVISCNALSGEGRETREVKSPSEDTKNQFTRLSGSPIRVGLFTPETAGNSFGSEKPMENTNKTTAANVRQYKNETFTALDLAVIEQMGGEARNTSDGCEIDEDTAQTLKDVSRCSAGAAGGFSGFIYYAETSDFAMKNRGLIVAKLREDVENGFFCDEHSNECGGIVSAVMSFNCLKTKDRKERGELEEEVAKCLFGDPEAYKAEYTGIVANALAWAALEDLAFRFCDWEAVED